MKAFPSHMLWHRIGRFGAAAHRKSVESRDNRLAHLVDVLKDLRISA